MLLLIIIACGIGTRAYATLGAINATTTSVCIHSSIAYTHTTTGGTWASSNTTVATVAAGMITGVATGTATISYTVGAETVTKVVTVSYLPGPDPIAGTMHVCISKTVTLSCPTAGGTWTMQHPSVATIGSATGIATGVINNVTEVRYTIANGCSSRAPFTVYTTPSVINVTHGCVGMPLSNDITPVSYGGTWSTSNPAIGTIDASGTVTGLTAGTLYVTYTSPEGCTSTVGTATSIYALPAIIAGTTSINCTGTTTLSNITPGGTWSSSTPSVATVGSSGVVTAVSPGTTTITYRLTSTGGCYSTIAVSVNTASISGSSSVCVGSTISLSGTAGGGTWSSSNAGVATVSSSGVVSGVSTGTATVTYSLGASCYSTRVITVSNVGISGGTTMLPGGSTTLSATGGSGTWSSGNTSVATIGFATGIVTGVAAGTAIITFTSAAGCTATATVNVMAGNICELAPVATCDNVIAYCTGMKLKVHAPAGSGISWSVSPEGCELPEDDGHGDYIFPAVPAQGTYTLTATIVHGGVTVNATVAMVVNSGCYPCDYFKSGVTGVCSSVPYFKTIVANTLNNTNITTGTPYYFIANDALIDINPPAGDLFFIGRGVELSVEDAITLSGVHLFSAGGSCMWKGIKVVNNDPVIGQLTIDDNTLVEHASIGGAYLKMGVGIASAAPATGNVIKCDHAIFNWNNNGIRIDSFILDDSIANYPFEIENSVFTNRQLNTYIDETVTSPACTTAYYPFVWPSATYLKTAVTTGDNPGFNVDAFDGVNIDARGITVINSGATDMTGFPSDDTYYSGAIYNGITIGNLCDSNADNLFDSLYAGALIANSNVKFYNNIFRRTKLYGKGIWGYQLEAPGGKKAIELLHGASLNTNNRFYNCHYGFLSEGNYTFISKGSSLSATLYDNTIGSTGMQNYGFLAMNTEYGNYIIEDNTCRNLYGGIVMEINSSTSPHGRVEITGNNILDLSSSSGNELGYFGIRLLDNNGTSTTAAGTLNIANNYVRGSVWGIQVYGNGTIPASILTSINNNEVAMLRNSRSGATTRSGIVVRQHNQLAQVTGNYIHGDPGNGMEYDTDAPGVNDDGLQAHVGIHLHHVNSSASADISCNFVHDLPIGFRFEHENTVNWHQNTMMRNKYGMVLHSYYDNVHNILYPASIGAQGTTCAPSDNTWYDDGSSVSGWADWFSAPVYQTFVVAADPAGSELYVRNYSSGGHSYAPVNNGAGDITDLPTTYTGIAYGNWTTIVNSSSVCTGTLASVPAICAPAIPSEKPGHNNNDMKTVVDGSGSYTLSPNPSAGAITIRQAIPVDASATVRVLNYAGLQVYSGSLDFVNGSASLSITKAVPGIYMVLLANEKGETSSYKIVIH